MHDFTLYNAPQSTCSQRVRFTLHAKEIVFHEHTLDLFRGDQLEPEYLALNPNGVVPTLVHDGRVVIESAVIIEYLDEMFEAPQPLSPMDPFERARMRALIHYIDEVPTPAVRVPSYNLGFLRHFQTMTDEEFLAMAESKPLRKEFFLKMGKTGFPEDVLNEALDRLGRGIARMNAEIESSGGPWLLGNQLTLADISIMPVIVRANDIGLAHLWGEMPAVGAWLDKIRETPPFAPTYYRGSLLSEKYPGIGE